MNLFTSLYYRLLNLRNHVDFSLRQGARLTARPVDHRNTSRPDILSAYPAEIREKAGGVIARLRSVYHFDAVEAGFEARDLQENYFYLAMLDEVFSRSQAAFPETLTAADIGPSSWFYVQALAAALTWYGVSVPRALRLTGYEVDAYRLYSDFHTRKDHALGNMRGLAGVTYVDQPFRAQPDTYDVLTTFFPFVFEKDLLEWGLPGSLFQPDVLLAAAFASLKPGGMLVIVNQGEQEHEAQEELLRQHGITPLAAFRMDPLLFEYPLDRWIITVKK